MQISFKILAAILCVGAAPASVADRLLAAHNGARQEVGAPPLKWDAKLASDAAAWAKHMASTGDFDHATDVEEGENLWMGTKGRSSPEQMVGAWIDEKRDFKPGRFPAVTKTNDVDDVGHYTQLIWRATTKVGCAIAVSAENDFLVCRYSPAGNVQGQDVVVSTPAKKAPPPVLKKRRRGG